MERRVSIARWLFLLLLSIFCIPWNGGTEVAALELTEAERAFIRANPKLHVLGRGGISPFLLPSKEGAEAQGLAVDYIRLVFSRIGIEPEFVGMENWKKAQERLSAKDRMDVLSIAVSIPVNQKRWALSEDYFSSPVVLFSRNETEVRASIKQFAGQRVGYVRRARFTKALRDKNAELNWIAFDGPEQMMVALAKGEIEGAVLVVAVGAYFVNQLGLSDLKVSTPLDIPPLKIAFAVRKEQQILSDILSKGIRSITQEEHAAIRNKWLVVKFEYGISPREVALWSAGGVALVLLIGLIFFAWNRKLASEVALRSEAEKSLATANEELKGLAEKANAATRAKDEFLAAVSHELRTPLTSIIGVLGMVTAGALDAAPEKRKETLWLALRNAKRLLAIINDLLDMQKVVLDDAQLDLTPLSVADLVGKAVQENQGYGLHFGVSVDVEGGLPEAMVSGEEGRLIQVLSNLISNAVKASSQGAKVGVSCAKLEDEVVISVRDTGSGIPEDLRDKIFERFTQADMGTTRSSTGTGLGLALSKELVERHNGFLRFESEIGKGTTFFLALPLLKRN